MSSRRLVAAVFTAALTLGLIATASAGAHKIKFHHTPGCLISMYAQPTQITDGEPVELYGQLTCNGTPVAGKTVTIRVRTSVHGKFKVLGTTTTTELGAYAVEVPYDKVNAQFQATTTLAVSKLRAVRVTPQVTLTGPGGTTLYTGKAHEVTFSGWVTPADHGAQVVLQREESTGPENWRAIQWGKVHTHGFFAFVHRFVVAGNANLRVVVRPHGQFTTRGISNILSYGISQTENPALTINTSSVITRPGGTVTISGATTAGEGATVKLYGRPNRHGPFTEVGSVKAGAGGAYSFEETIHQNMLFQAHEGTTLSAVLFQGTRYGLTLTTTFPTTLASGEKLTVEGSVEGAEPGHPVYLERENRFGHTFHVIDETTVNPEGKFKLEYALFGSGRTDVRVKVAGDPGHQATWTNPAAIELTPSPPTLVLPTSPTPVLPVEGKV